SERLDLEELKKLREKFLDLRINIQEIEFVKESLTKLRQEVESLNTQQKSIQLEFDKVKRFTREAQIKTDSLETVKHELIYKLENASLEYKLNDVRLKELEQLTKNIENKKRDAETKKQEKFELDELITITKQRVNEVKSNKFNSKLVELYPDIRDEFTLAVKSFGKSSDLKKTLDSLELELEQSQALDSDIKSLVKSGTNLISRNSLSSCPLCSNEYSDFKELLNAIESNLLFDVRLKSLVARKNSIELSYIEEREKFLSAKNSILYFLYDLIDTYETNISKIESLRIEIIQDKHN
ncbi:hypothetical protein, partial [Vibrio owensii]|uniref:hypothetical protein n=1 Tax=Vibrio owensii TaxID=696485 RepID=UPI00058717AE